jgi:hypothetical protein
MFSYYISKFMGNGVSGHHGQISATVEVNNGVEDTATTQSQCLMEMIVLEKL